MLIEFHCVFSHLFYSADMYFSFYYYDYVVIGVLRPLWFTETLVCCHSLLVVGFHLFAISEICETFDSRRAGIERELASRADQTVLRLQGMWKEWMSTVRPELC